MFTGIVEAKGTLKRFSGSRLEIEAPQAIARSLKKGGSLAVNGTCLTLTEKRGRRLFFNVITETRRRTTFPGLKPGDALNLERPMRAGSRFDGHVVLGHVDGRGTVRRVRPERSGKSFFLACPSALSRLALEKGSVAVDGVSLTVGKKTPGGFWVHIIPLTLRKTRFAGYRPGSRVNLEMDALMKAVLLTSRARRVKLKAL